MSFVFASSFLKICKEFEKVLGQNSIHCNIHMQQWSQEESKMCKNFHNYLLNQICHILNGRFLGALHFLRPFLVNFHCLFHFFIRNYVKDKNFQSHFLKFTRPSFKRNHTHTMKSMFLHTKTNTPWIACFCTQTPWHMPYLQVWAAGIWSVTCRKCRRPQPPSCVGSLSAGPCKPCPPLPPLSDRRQHWPPCPNR